MDKQKILLDFAEKNSVTTTHTLPVNNNLEDMNQDFHMLIDTATSAPKHIHWYLEMGYVLEGRANHVWNNKNEILESGSYFIIGHVSSHSYMATTKNFKVMNIMFNPAFFDEHLAGSKTFFEILGSRTFNFDINLFSVKPTPYTFKDKDGSIRKIIMEMYNEYELKRAGYLELIRSKMIEIFIKSVRPLYINMPHSYKNKSDAFSRVLQFINTHYMKPIALEEICRISNYTVPYMSKKFKQTFGMTFREYVTQLRITAARRYLANTDKSIDEIMDLVGYKDKKSFYTAFKKVSDITPNAYRRKRKNAR